MCSHRALTSMVDILTLLEHVEDYVLIKIWDDFPMYTHGGDLDLVVLDREQTIQSVLRYFEELTDSRWEMRVEDTEGHCHIDFILEGDLELRVDLIDDFGFFERIAVKPAFKTKLFMDRKELVLGEKRVYVPDDEDDLTLRYFEYLEWFDRRPDKIGHLDYICTVEDERLRHRFFVNTHRFIQFKRKSWPASTTGGGSMAGKRFTEPQSRREALRQVEASLRYLVSATLRSWRKALWK